MPNYDLGWLITLNIGLTLIGLCVAVIGIGFIMRQGARTSASAERIAEIAERIDARLRRQYTDIDRDLQQIKELLGGQP